MPEICLEYDFAAIESLPDKTVAGNRIEHPAIILIRHVYKKITAVSRDGCTSISWPSGLFRFRRPAGYPHCRHGGEHP